MFSRLGFRQPPLIASSMGVSRLQRCRPWYSLQFKLPHSKLPHLTIGGGAPCSVTRMSS